MKIFVTGDCHKDFTKFTTKRFPIQKALTKEDIVFGLGDLGLIWDYQPPYPYDNYQIRWFDEVKPFTLVYIDGNHENFDRLKEYPIVNFYGAKAHKISDSVYHILRGEILTIEGLRIFCFGGARSHDIEDGILSRENYSTDSFFKLKVREYRKKRKRFRINHETWWKEELPSQEEFDNAEKNLKSVGYRVDCIMTHCAPQRVVDRMFPIPSQPDILTEYFDSLVDRVSFDRWYFGHYHDYRELGKYTLLYNDIIQLR